MYKILLFTSGILTLVGITYPDAIVMLLVSIIGIPIGFAMMFAPMAFAWLLLGGIVYFLQHLLPRSWRKPLPIWILSISVPVLIAFIIAVLINYMSERNAFSYRVDDFNNIPSNLDLRSIALVEVRRYHSRVMCNDACQRLLLKKTDMKIMVTSGLRWDNFTAKGIENVSPKYNGMFWTEKNTSECRPPQLEHSHSSSYKLQFPNEPSRRSNQPQPDRLLGHLLYKNKLCLRQSKADFATAGIVVAYGPIVTNEKFDRDLSVWGDGLTADRIVIWRRKGETFEKIFQETQTRYNTLLQPLIFGYDGYGLNLDPEFIRTPNRKKTGYHSHLPRIFKEHLGLPLNIEKSDYEIDIKEVIIQALDKSGSVEPTILALSDEFFKKLKHSEKEEQAAGNPLVLRLWQDHRFGLPQSAQASHHLLSIASPELLPEFRKAVISRFETIDKRFGPEDAKLAKSERWLTSSMILSFSDEANLTYLNERLVSSKPLPQRFHTLVEELFEKVAKIKKSGQKAPSGYADFALRYWKDTRRKIPRNISDFYSVVQIQKPERLAEFREDILVQIPSIKIEPKDPIKAQKRTRDFEQEKVHLLGSFIAKFPSQELITFVSSQLDQTGELSPAFLTILDRFPFGARKYHAKAQEDMFKLGIRIIRDPRTGLPNGVEHMVHGLIDQHPNLLITFYDALLEKKKLLKVQEFSNKGYWKLTPVGEELDRAYRWTDRGILYYLERILDGRTQPDLLFVKMYRNLESNLANKDKEFKEKITRHLAIVWQKPDLNVDIHWGHLPKWVKAYAPDLLPQIKHSVLEQFAMMELEWHQGDQIIVNPKLTSMREFFDLLPADRFKKQLPAFERLAKTQKAWTETAILFEYVKHVGPEALDLILTTIERADELGKTQKRAADRVTEDLLHSLDTLGKGNKQAQDFIINRYLSGVAISEAGLLEQTNRFLSCSSSLGLTQDRAKNVLRKKQKTTNSAWQSPFIGQRKLPKRCTKGISIRW